MKQYIEVNDLLMWMEMQIRNCTDSDEKKVLQKVASKMITFPKANVREAVTAEWISIQSPNLITNKPMLIHYCSHCKTVGNPTKRFCCECGAEMTT